MLKNFANFFSPLPSFSIHSLNFASRARSDLRSLFRCLSPLTTFHSLSSHNNKTNYNIFTCPSNKKTNDDSSFEERESSIPTRVLYDSTENVPVHQVAWSPSASIIVAACGDATLKMWDSSTGAYLTSLLGHTSSVTSLAFSYDGDVVVSGDESGVIRVWDAIDRGACVAVRDDFVSEDGGVYSVEFSPDGEWLCSGSETGRVRQWAADI